MPDLVPAVPSQGARQPLYRFEPSAIIEAESVAQEVPSQRKQEGNVISGAGTKTFNIPTERGLEASLFQNRAQLKLITAQVAMHLTGEQRHAIFSAIDTLLDAEEWEDESSQIGEGVFRTFLRFIIFARLQRMPNLGVSWDGMLLAGWHAEKKSVHAEFLTNDQCVAIIRLETRRGPERVAWRGHVARLRDAIINNGASDCIQ